MVQLSVKLDPASISEDDMSNNGREVRNWNTIEANNISKCHEKDAKTVNRPCMEGKARERSDHLSTKNMFVTYSQC